MKIIKRSKFVETVAYRLVYDFEGLEGSGFAFPCDQDGKLEPLNKAAQASYDACLTGSIVCAGGVVRKLRAARVEKYERSYRKPAIGLCSCGAEVELGGFTNTCNNCETDYNSAGQQLAPREQWGEETGETAADILMADVDSWNDPDRF